MSIKIKFNITQWNELQLNYWGITKCGNTSVKYSLLQSSRKRDIIKRADHHGAESWIHSEKNAIYIDRKTALTNGYFNFAVVRNPYKRFVSMYKDVLRRGPHFFKKEAFTIKTIDDLLNFIEDVPDNEREIHFRSQCYFITNDKGEILVDKLIDVEDGFEISKITGHEIEYKNVIEKKVNLSGVQEQKVYEIFKNDFKKLGYEK